MVPCDYFPGHFFIVTYRFSRERIESNEAPVKYIPTNMTADILTKSLAYVEYGRHMERMGLVSASTLSPLIFVPQGFGSG